MGVETAFLNFRLPPIHKAGSKHDTLCVWEGIFSGFCIAAYSSKYLPLCFALAEAIAPERRSQQQ